MGGVRIIVVDDNHKNAEMLCRCLRKLATKPIICKDGDGCLAEVADGNVAVIFIEVFMLGISGFDVLKSIRQKYDPIELPVIMLTDRKDDAILAKGFCLGANEFVYKPIDCLVSIARIYHQLRALEMHKKSLEKSNREIINLMRATYNYEINNSLSVAFAELHLAQMDNDSATLTRVSNALGKIRVVIREIEKSQVSDLQETGYLLEESA
ncbi:MAG: response regulator [Desulfobulbaceae bacterium]|nr:response regulator [Desulfobulbaceae bacterium]